MSWGWRPIMYPWIRSIELIHIGIEMIPSSGWWSIKSSMMRAPWSPAMGWGSVVPWTLIRTWTPRSHRMRKLGTPMSWTWTSGSWTIWWAIHPRAWTNRVLFTESRAMEISGPRSRSAIRSFPRFCKMFSESSTIVMQLPYCLGKQGELSKNC